MNRNETLSILKELKHSPNKKLGQNFLIDNNVLDKIISASELKKNDVILEIGAGLGALTSELIKRVEKVYSYEIDKTLYRFLKNKFSSSSNIELFNQDILKARIPAHNKVVSNIPYSITGPILEKVFYNSSPPSGILIIEKSLANRIFVETNYKYFSRMKLPPKPTLYDHLVLSLRSKDLIATFNWDPFLYYACLRNHKHATLPHTAYLHGNVAIGYCLEHKNKGMIGYNCNVCNKPYEPSKLLYPVLEKNYAKDPFISAEWATLRRYLKNAYILDLPCD